MYIASLDVPLQFLYGILNFRSLCNVNSFLTKDNLHEHIRGNLQTKGKWFYHLHFFQIQSPNFFLIILKFITLSTNLHKDIWSLSEASIAQHWSCKPGVVSSNLTEGFWKSWEDLHLNNNAKTKEVDKSSPNVGLEPTTLRLRVSCSTDWASRAYLLWFFWIKGWCRLVQDWRIIFRLKKSTHPWYRKPFRRGGRVVKAMDC